MSILISNHAANGLFMRPFIQSPSYLFRYPASTNNTTKYIWQNSISNEHTIVANFKEDCLPLPPISITNTQKYQIQFITNINPSHV